MDAPQRPVRPKQNRSPDAVPTHGTDTWTVPVGIMEIDEYRAMMKGQLDPFDAEELKVFRARNRQ